METNELLLYAGGVCMLGAALVVFVWLTYSGAFVQRNRLKIQAPIMRGRTQLHTPAYGWCEVTGYDRLGRNSASIHLADQYGNKYVLPDVDGAELLAVDPFFNLGGNGNPAYRYVPSRERQVSRVQIDALRESLMDQVVAARREGETNESKYRNELHNRNMLVNDVVSSVGSLAKSSRPEAPRRQ